MSPRISATVSIVLLALLLAGSATSGHAKPATTTESWPWKIPSRKTFLAQIPPPPAPNSATARRDLATVLALQAKATPAKIAQAKSTYDLTVFTYAPAIGRQFTPANYPETAKFFRQLNNLVNYVNNYVKDADKRPHPFQVSPLVHRYVIAPAGYSYPSYHSARCVVFQGVLEELDPARAHALTPISHEVEEDRVFAGEHFPSDIAAGRQLGHLIWAALEKDANFHADIARLKQAEWTPPPAPDK